MPRDSIQIEILEDGSFKLNTGRVSISNHKSADDLINFLHQLAGGERKTESTKEKAHHAHHHQTKETHHSH